MWSSLLRQLQNQGDWALESLQKYLVNKWVDKKPHPAQKWEPVQGQWRIRALSSNSCYQGDQGESPDLLRDSVTMSAPNGVSKWHWLWWYYTYSFFYLPEEFEVWLCVARVIDLSGFYEYYSYYPYKTTFPIIGQRKVKMKSKIKRILLPLHSPAFGRLV